jgi:hypothetical protein
MNNKRKKKRDTSHITNEIACITLEKNLIGHFCFEYEKGNERVSKDRSERGRKVGTRKKAA